MKFAVAFLSVLLCTAPLSAQGGGGGDPVGSLPKVSAKDKDKCKDGTVHVGAGGSAYNADGVTVTTSASSSGSCSLTPKNGGTGCKSQANPKAGWNGSISGLDDNDTSTVMGGATGTIGSSGGTSISIAPGSSITVINTAPVGGLGVNVNTPSGPFTVPPQGVQTFNTRRMRRTARAMPASMLARLRAAA